jgi:arginine/serine-rich splicing factor 7
MSAFIYENIYIKKNMSLFIGNTANKVTKKELEDLFNKYGKCDINYKGAFAFAEYSLDKEAEIAKSELNKKEVNGRVLSIEWSKKSKNYTKKTYNESSPRVKCYICGRGGHFARDCHKKRRSDSYRHYHSRRRYRSRSRSHHYHHRRYSSSRSPSKRISRRRSPKKRSYRSRSRSKSSYHRKSRNKKNRKIKDYSEDSRIKKDNDNKDIRNSFYEEENNNENNNEKNYIKEESVNNIK